MNTRPFTDREAAHAVSVGRDPFARGNVVRVTVPKAERTSCAWCGGAPGRFRYGWADDQGRRHSALGTRGFCSRSCERSFNS